MNFPSLSLMSMISNEETMAIHDGFQSSMVLVKFLLANMMMKKLMITRLYGLWMSIKLMSSVIKKMLPLMMVVMTHVMMTMSCKIIATTMMKKAIVSMMMIVLTLKMMLMRMLLNMVV